MKFIYSAFFIAALSYLAVLASLYFFQRNLLYFPVPVEPDIPRQEVTFKNDNLLLHGWVLNPDKEKALIYFGGNSEAITNNIPQFEITFKNYSVYLVNYRGYGNSEGTPTEAGLFSDAIAIYNELDKKHASISLMGRSLGSGVAVYLASKRHIEKLFLLTPYDSIAEVAHSHYPIFPTRHMVRDRFESTRYAPDVSAPVLIIAAELDRVVPLKHTEKLRGYFPAENIRYALISRAAHNDVTDFPQYHEALEAFINF